MDTEVASEEATEVVTEAEIEVETEEVEVAINNFLNTINSQKLSKIKET